MLVSEARGHSSQVQIRLYVGGRVLSVSQVGDESLILRESSQNPPASGIIEVVVDGVEQRYAVCLHEGIPPESKVVHFREVCLLDANHRCDHVQRWLFDDGRTVPF